MLNLLASFLVKSSLSMSTLSFYSIKFSPFIQSLPPAHHVICHLNSYIYTRGKYRMLNIPIKIDISYPDILDILFDYPIRKPIINQSTAKITVCIWFIIQFISLFLSFTILITTNHPFWIGQFEHIFYQFENDITIPVRPYFQTEQYSSLLLQPESASEISNIIINYGIKQNRTIRAIGCAHSSAPLFTNDIIISLNKFKHIQLKLIQNENNINKNTIIIGAGAGWSVEDTENYLYKHDMLGTGVYGVFGPMTKYLNAVWIIDGNGNNLYITNKTIIHCYLLSK